ncbi:MAG: tetratricopeptide repeat protein [Pseudomonadales bacterium]|nr:tetratricopeptide repeat protein [Pseudomonadales bacterium]
MNRKQRRSQLRQQKSQTKKLKKVSQSARDPDKLMILGDQLIAARNFLAAADAYKRALKKDRSDIPVLRKIGYAYASGGKITLAIKCYENILSFDQKDVEAAKSLATVYHAIRQHDKALSYIKPIAGLLQDDPDMQYLLAELFDASNDRDKSIECYLEAIKLFARSNRKHNSATLARLARACAKVGQPQTAIDALNLAVQQTPEMPGAYFELAKIYNKLADTKNALRYTRQLLKLVPQHASGLYLYAGLMANKGLFHQSGWAFRRLSHIFPEASTIKHFASTYLGIKTEIAVDAEYVADLFDDYADEFDEHLVDVLKYQTPARLTSFLVTASKENLTDLVVLDLGCGTGLCGSHIRPWAKKLIGVDLSKGMLAKAAEKNIYDALLLSDLVVSLAEYENELDLVISTDVLIYLADLAQVFAGCVRALTATGIFAFSIESTNARLPKLDKSGRYQFSHRYIVDLARQNNFAIRAFENTIIRQEQGQPVQGALYLLVKSAA